MITCAKRRSHVFVDESKTNEYVLVASVVPPSDLSSARAFVQSLRHKGSRSIHMRTESDATRGRILDALGDFGFETRISVSGSDRRELLRRRDCLRDVVQQCAEIQAQRLVLELDQSIVKHDRQLMIEECRRQGMPADFTYEWMKRHEEPLLWVSDAVGWAFAKGGRWRARADPLIVDR